MQCQYVRNAYPEVTKAERVGKFSGQLKSGQPGNSTRTAPVKKHLTNYTTCMYIGTSFMYELLKVGANHLVT